MVEGRIGEEWRDWKMEDSLVVEEEERKRNREWKEEEEEEGQV